MDSPFSVDYEFTWKDYAVDFVVLNHDAEWAKIKGVHFRDAAIQALEVNYVRV